MKSGTQFLRFLAESLSETPHNVLFQPARNHIKTQHPQQEYCLTPTSTPHPEANIANLSKLNTRDVTNVRPMCMRQPHSPGLLLAPILAHLAPV